MFYIRCIVDLVWQLVQINAHYHRSRNDEFAHARPFNRAWLCTWVQTSTIAVVTILLSALICLLPREYACNFTEWYHYNFSLSIWWSVDWWLTLQFLLFFHPLSDVFFSWFYSRSDLSYQGSNEKSKVKFTMLHTEIYATIIIIQRGTWTLTCTLIVMQCNRRLNLYVLQSHGHGLVIFNIKKLKRSLRQNS